MIRLVGSHVAGNSTGTRPDVVFCHEIDLGARAEAVNSALEYWRLDRSHVIAHDFGGMSSIIDGWLTA